jgi:hypothetical protein
VTPASPPPWIDRSWPFWLQVGANLLVGVACLFLFVVMAAPGWVLERVPVPVGLFLLGVASVATVAVIAENLVAKLKE